MNSVTAALVLSLGILLFTSLGAHGATTGVVQRVSIDLDGDEIPDTVSEISHGGKMNRLRIGLSKSKKVYSYTNVLANSEIKEEDVSWCNSVQPNVLKVVAKKHPNRPNTILIETQKGTDGGCETGFGYTKEKFTLLVEEDGKIMIKTFSRSSVGHAHHEYHNIKSSEFDFYENSVHISEDCSYNGNDMRARKVQMSSSDGNRCELSLNDYNMARKLPACAADVNAEIWKKLWPAAEKKESCAEEY